MKTFEVGKIYKLSLWGDFQYYLIKKKTKKYVYFVYKCKNTNHWGGDDKSKLYIDERGVEYCNPIYYMSKTAKMTAEDLE